MIIRIEYYNGDWEVLTSPIRDFDTFLGGLREDVEYLVGTIDGRQAAISLSSLRSIQEWPDELRDD